MAHQVKCKYKDLSSIPSTYIKVGQGAWMSLSLVLGIGWKWLRWKDPGAYWLMSLTQ